MTDDFNTYFEPVKKHAALTDSERISVRNNLVAFMAEHPVQPSLMARISSHLASYVSIVSSRAVARPLGFAFVLALVVGVGTSSAAETALPGDPLYAVKINLNERVESMFVRSEGAKAEWNAERVERRLQEVEELVANGKLTAVAQDEIEKHLDAAVRSFDESVAKLAADSAQVVAAAEVQSRVEASLIGHERVLAALSAQVPDIASAAGPILATVREQTENVESDRKRSERVVAARTNGEIRTAAADSRHVADTALQEVRTMVASQNFEASTTADVGISALHVEEAIEIGDEKLKRGLYGEAFGTYQAALRAVRAVQVNLEAEARLGTPLVPADASLMMEADTTVETDAHEDDR